MTTPPVPRFLRFRWLFAAMVLALAGVAVWLKLWHWWPRAPWLERIEVVGAAVGFAAFEAAALAVVAKSTVVLKAEIDASIHREPKRAPWWPIWTGRRRP